MSLEMSKQARIELLSVWRAKYASVGSRYKEARIINYIIQSAGYKNRKTVIRLLSNKKAPPGKKKRGRRKMIGGKKLQVISKIWFLMGQPCGKRMVAQLPRANALENWIHFKEGDKRFIYALIRCQTICHRVYLYPTLPSVSASEVALSVPHDGPCTV